MVVVNCDQDHRPDLKPGSVMKANAEPDSLTPTTSVAMSATQDTPNENTKAVLDAAVSEVWYLKPITFAGRRTRVITQNFNGSVSTAHRVAVV